MIQLSPHFSYAEAIISEYAARNGIDNTPPQDLLKVMVHTALCMERVRDSLGEPIHVTSWYRCPKLNEAISGQNHSQHMAGEAVDFICPLYGSPAVIAKHIADNRHVIQFDQLILEHQWIHISFKHDTATQGLNRNQIISLVQNGHYVLGLTDVHGNYLVYGNTGEVKS